LSSATKTTGQLEKVQFFEGGAGGKESAGVPGCDVDPRGAVGKYFIEAGPPKGHIGEQTTEKRGPVGSGLRFRSVNRPKRRAKNKTYDGRKRNWTRLGGAFYSRGLRGRLDW